LCKSYTSKSHLQSFPTRRSSDLPKCGGYFRVHAYRRIEMVGDEGTFEEWDKGLCTRNPLHYKGYEEKIAHLQEKTGLEEAVVTGDRKSTRLNSSHVSNSYAVCCL